MSYETITTDIRNNVAIITFNRPKALNALNAMMISEINAALDGFDASPEVRCIVITGNEKAFAAGADIREMKDLSKVEAQTKDFLKIWDHIGTIRTPIIAAVSGFCFGGGFELALACDLIVASNTAKFGLPEVTLGIMPGVGGTQRLTSIIGKSKAMEMILTGRTIDAAEAEQLGIAARVIAVDHLQAESFATAEKIANLPVMAIQTAKRAVNTALELPLAAGNKAERTAFYGLFDTEDQKEGMTAFLEKRKALFKHR